MYTLGVIRTARRLRLLESQTFVSLTPSFGGRRSVYIESRLRVLDEIAPLVFGLAQAARVGGMAAARGGAAAARFGAQALRAARPIVQRGAASAAKLGARALKAARPLAQRGGRIAKQFGQRFGKAASSARSTIAKKAPEIIGKAKRLARLAKVTAKRAVGREVRSGFKLLSGRGTLRSGAPRQIQRLVNRFAGDSDSGSSEAATGNETPTKGPNRQEPAQEPTDAGDDGASVDKPTTPETAPDRDKGKDKKSGSTHGSAGLPVVGIKDKCPTPNTKTSAFGGYRARGQKRCSPQTQPRAH